VRYDSRAVAVRQLIRIAEAEILGREVIEPLPSSKPVNCGRENVMVVVAAVGEFALPLVAPVASGLLVLASLGTFGAAASQLRERGSPPANIHLRRWREASSATSRLLNILVFPLLNNGYR
jgi:hypothetical protein